MEGSKLHGRLSTYAKTIYIISGHMARKHGRQTITKSKRRLSEEVIKTWELIRGNANNLTDETSAIMKSGPGVM